MIKPVNGVYLTNSDFPSFEGKSISFCVTGDCNLRCTYCYIHHKSNDRDMTFETAKKIVDTMLENPHEYLDDTKCEENKSIPKSSGKRKLVDKIAFDMIGGEPFIRTPLNARISKYILYQMLNEELNYATMFSFSTNGVTYTNPEVQDYIGNYRDILSVGITIDGTKQMHDACRIFPDGSGSFDFVKKSVELWKKQFPDHGTKITISHENLPYIAEALIYLWTEIGLQYLPANVVFEDVWKDGDTEIFEKQLHIIADFLLKDGNHRRYLTTLFDDTIGKKIDAKDIKPPCGGNGAMLFWMDDGSFYNCIRYAPYSCKSNIGYQLGSLDKGWDENKIAALESMDRRTSSDDECFNCDIASGCSYCPGAQFDYFGDPNRRAKFLCRMHKARVKVNDYYFGELAARNIRKESYIDMSIDPRMDEVNNNFVHIGMIKSFIRANVGEYDIDANKLIRKMERLLTRNLEVTSELRDEYKIDDDMILDPRVKAFRKA
jgi:uncharacterized protein